VLCEECFPPVKPERKSAKRFTAEPVKVEEKRSKAKETLETLVGAGYEPESVDDAITTGDLSKVKRADDSDKAEEPDGTSDKG
jgi:hypothetical protein